MVDGTNDSDSRMEAVTIPSTSCALIPASSSAALASIAHCSSDVAGFRVGFRSASSSTRPTIAASPRSPIPFRPSSFLA
jgi:hypothetical protein